MRMDILVGARVSGWPNGYSMHVLAGGGRGAATRRTAAALYGCGVRPREVVMVVYLLAVCNVQLLLRQAVLQRRKCQGSGGLGPRAS